jgi:hypothetical protein
MTHTTMIIGRNLLPVAQLAWMVEEGGGEFDLADMLTPDMARGCPPREEPWRSHTIDPLGELEEEPIFAPAPSDGRCERGPERPARSKRWPIEISDVVDPPWRTRGVSLAR